MCGPVRSQPGGPVEKIVVCGGALYDISKSKVEVYDVQEDSWEEGRRNKRDKDLYCRCILL